MSDSAKTKQVLRERAQTLARQPVDERAARDAIDVIEFKLADERYALETQYVREVYPFKDLTLVPCTPAFVRGVINVRGKILAVIDIKRFFDLPEQGIGDLHKVLIVETAQFQMGILADDVVGMRSVPLTELQAGLPTLTGIREQYLKGVTAEGLVVLDGQKILSDKSIIVHEEVEA